VNVVDDLKGFGAEDKYVALFMYMLDPKRGSISQTIAMKHPETPVIFLCLNTILRFQLIFIRNFIVKEY
jgi:hypothetical protein